MDAGGREFRFHVDLYSQESTFPLVFYFNDKYYNTDRDSI